MFCIHTFCDTQLLRKSSADAVMSARGHQRTGWSRRARLTVEIPESPGLEAKNMRVRIRGIFENIDPLNSPLREPQVGFRSVPLKGP